MATGAPPVLDLAHEIKIDHDNVRQLLEQFKSSSTAPDAEKAKISHTLVREVTIHCQAEELILYKAYRDKGFAKEVDREKEDHEKMDRSFQFLDSLRPNAPRFDQHVIDAVEAFLKHSDEEERVLPELIDKLSEEENTRLTRDFLRARTTVPTHPHPGSPHSGGFAQKVFIPLGKVGDSISEALGGKREYVGLAHEHAAITF